MALPGRTATFQGLPSLDGNPLAKSGKSRDFVYNAQLEADKFGRPAPVKHWPGLVLEDPSATAEAINAWASRSPTVTSAASAPAAPAANAARAPAATAASVPAATAASNPTGGGKAPPAGSRKAASYATARSASAGGARPGASRAGARRQSSGSGTDETCRPSDDEYGRQPRAAQSQLAPTTHGWGGWNSTGADPLLARTSAVARGEEKRQYNDGWIHNPAAARSGAPHQPAPHHPEDKTSAPVCPFCPAVYDESVGAEPGRKTRRVRPKAVSRTTQKHGRWWQTLGYGGPAYCQRCSEVFRDHIIRQKPNSAQCSRDHPCDECAGLLQHFTGGVDLLWQKIDARSYAPDSKRKGKSKPAQKKQRLSR